MYNGCIITAKGIIMKQRILVSAVTAAMLVLSGCSTTSNKPTDVTRGDLVQPGSSASTAIADQRLAVSDFRSQGIKLFYNTKGEIEAIESTGYAATWGNSMNSAREAFRVAELEAKKSLNDFINKETITSSVSVRMISQNLERASDQNTNRFASNQGANTELVALDSEVNKQPEDTNQTQNTAVRNNALRIASTLNTTITTNNRGILGGLYQKEARVVDGGRAVQVTMRWDRKHNQSRQQLRNMMAQ
jgi:hypothetical protein